MTPPHKKTQNRTLLPISNGILALNATLFSVEDYQFQMVAVCHAYVKLPIPNGSEDSV